MGNTDQQQPTKPEAIARIQSYLSLVVTFGTVIVWLWSLNVNLERNRSMMRNIEYRLDAIEARLARIEAIHLNNGIR